MRKLWRAPWAASWSAAGMSGVVAGALLLSGCGKSSGSKQPAPPSTQGAVDLTPVRKAFELADPSFRFPLEESLRIVESGGYADALPQLRKLAANPKLTAEQKQALQDLVQKLQAIPARAAPR